jgi:uncharacterized membrane protein
MANSKEIAASIIFAAAVAASTLVIRVPIPGTGGYFNLGDTLVLSAALLFGWRVGAFAGGVGSALADIVGGFPAWAPLTLVAKGLEGLAAGYLRSTAEFWKNVIAVSVGGTIMVLIYFIGEFTIPFYGGPSGAIAELPFNLVQAISAIILSLIIVRAVKTAAPELLFVEEV